jgi:uncharacterized membrane protein
MGRLPAGAVPLRVVVVTGVAGTGSSSPTVKIGSADDDDKYVASAALVVTNGVASHTTIVTGGFATAEEIISATFGGTLPTNATYDAWLILEFMVLAQA